MPTTYLITLVPLRRPFQSRISFWLITADIAEARELRQKRHCLRMPVAVYDHVHAKFPNVTVIGRSLGSGVAVYLASVRKVDKLILITPYDSIENVAKKHFPIFPIGLLLKDKFDSASRVKDLTAKTLILIAENDKTIPRENTDLLVQQFPSDKVVVKTLAGTNHDSITSGAEYLKLISDFLGSNH